MGVGGGREGRALRAAAMDDSAEMFVYVQSVQLKAIVGIYGVFSLVVHSLALPVQQFPLPTAVSPTHQGALEGGLQRPLWNVTGRNHARCLLLTVARRSS